MTPADVELLHAWRDGDQDAGSELVARHFSVVFGFLRRRVGVDVARDLAQETFETCVVLRERLETGASIKGFLLGIARNLLLRHQRSDARSRSRAQERAEPSAPRLSPSGAIAMREEQRLLLVALRRLPEELQLTLELHYWEELTTQEVADMLGVAQGTVKWRLSSARERLREEIASLDTSDVGEATVRELDRWARSIHKLVES